MTDHDLIQKARDGLGTTRDEHHFNCSTRTDEGCDCYARRFLPFHLALDALEAAVARANQLEKIADAARAVVELAEVADPASIGWYVSNGFMTNLRAALTAVRAQKDAAR